MIIKDALTGGIAISRQGGSLLPRLGSFVGRALRCSLFGKYNFLNLPIVCKVAVANVVLTGLAVATGLWFAHSPLWFRGGGPHVGFLTAGIVAFVAGSGVLNYLIIRTALMPLDSLRRTVEAVSAGDWRARAPSTVLTDPSVELLRTTLNGMLDKLVGDGERLQALAAGLITAHEEERQRVARDLHDDIGQTITALLARLKLMEKLAAGPEIRAALEEAITVASGLSEAVGRVSYQMRPKILDDLGLVPALEAFIDTCCGRMHGVTVDFVARNLDRRLPGSVELALYRVLREALWNAGRHAHPTQIKVLLNRADKMVTGIVEDNGLGFDVERALQAPASSIGLLGMRERVSLVGGTFQLESRPGGPTRVLVEIPIE